VAVLLAGVICLARLGFLTEARRHGDTEVFLLPVGLWALCLGAFVRASAGFGRGFSRRHRGTEVFLGPVGLWTLCLGAFVRASAGFGRGFSRRHGDTEVFLGPVGLGLCALVPL